MKKILRLRRHFFSTIALCFVAASSLGASTDLPNIVLIFADDLGYGDLGAYGSSNSTPNLDRLAKTGARFTDFYVPQAVCSASRAALMTGCYPNRLGIHGALPPDTKIALHTNEVTIAEMLKRRGYTTAHFGKWHLGDRAPHLPAGQGFDIYYGLPYSNDMWPKHPTAGNRFPPLPLIEGEKVIQTMPDQTQLTTAYTHRAVQFIERSKNRPFFLYLAHSMPHVPLHVSQKFKGKTKRGLYADVIAELDWSVGEIINALAKTGLSERTLVMFSSDNGPWLLYGNHAGSAGPLREGKATSFEGGVRVPFIAHWPGRIPSGIICSEIATTMDLLPTIAKFTGADVPSDRKIDGKDISLLMTKRDAKTPHEAFFYYWHRELHAVRSGKWKLHFPHFFTRPNPAGADGKPGKFATEEMDLELYDLQKDPGERHNVAAANPDVVKKLEDLGGKMREDLGDLLTHKQGAGLRLPATLADKP